MKTAKRKLKRYYLETEVGDSFLAYHQFTFRPYWLEYMHVTSLKPKTFNTEVEVLAFFEEWVQKPQAPTFFNQAIRVVETKEWDEKRVRICRQHWYRKDLGEPYPQKPGAKTQEQPEQLRRYQEKK